jgi:hypothetical protein
LKGRQQEKFNRRLSLAATVSLEKKLLNFLFATKMATTRDITSEATACHRIKTSASEETWFVSEPLKEKKKKTLQE